MNLIKRISILKIILISFLTIVTVFLLINYFTFTNVNKLISTSDITRHTVEVLEHTEFIIAVLSDAETGQRGYLLTGELKYLEPYNSGIFLVTEEINIVKKLTEDNQAQQDRIATLEILVEQKKEELQQTVDLKASGQDDEAIAVVLSDKGKDIMDEIRGLILIMQTEEEDLLLIRQAEATRAGKNTSTIILFGSVIGLLASILITLVISRYIVTSIKKLRYVADKIAKGNMDIEVDTTGSNELSQLSQSIDTMRQKLREVDRMKTEFVSIASHQLRTPLSAIKWFLEMLLDGDAGKINKEQRDFLQQAFDSNTRMISLVNGLLNVSRLEAGRIAIEPVPTDLVKLCQVIINESKPLISAHHLKFKFTKPAKIDKINIDPKLISQVVANLLSNGIKYTPGKGKVELKISIEKPNIKISVVDSGMGIPRNQQSKLFQKFFRADNAVSKETEGTGLGLYVAKSVVEASGGKIGFNSEENKGSTFWFTLPLSGSKKMKGEKGLEKTRI